MTYRQLMYLHLATVLPCIVLGMALFLLRKGSRLHRRLGRVYLSLMMVTAIATLLMPAVVGLRWMNHFGLIHLFSVLTLGTVPLSYVWVRRGNVTAHRFSMIGLYLGAIVIAGSFTLLPGRYLHSLLFGN